LEPFDEILLGGFRVIAVLVLIFLVRFAAGELVLQANNKVFFEC
jgi:hypothetical protein